MNTCTKCGNETRTTHLTTPAGGDLLVAGTISADPQPIIAYVCAACGYTELYAPQPTAKSQAIAAVEVPLEAEPNGATPIPAA